MDRIPPKLDQHVSTLSTRLRLLQETLQVGLGIVHMGLDRCRLELCRAGDFLTCLHPFILFFRLAEQRGNKDPGDSLEQLKIIEASFCWMQPA